MSHPHEIVQPLRLRLGDTPSARGKAVTTAPRIFAVFGELENPPVDQHLPNDRIKRTSR
jgi:hypothetical protein